MSRKRTRRKHYVPVTPQHAIEGAAVVSEAALADIRAAERQALDAIHAGTATLVHIQRLTGVWNTARIMADEFGIAAPEIPPVAALAEVALKAMFERHKRHGTVGRAAGEWEILNELVELHQLQRTSVSRSEFERMIRRTHQRVHEERARRRKQGIPEDDA